MTDPKTTPGISRADLIPEESLQRLEGMLARGTGISDAVLAQWVRRYGEAARTLIERYGRKAPDR